MNSRLMKKVYAITHDNKKHEVVDWTLDRHKIIAEVENLDSLLELGIVKEVVVINEKNEIITSSKRRHETTEKFDPMLWLSDPKNTRKIEKQRISLSESLLFGEKSKSSWSKKLLEE